VVLEASAKLHARKPAAPNALANGMHEALSIQSCPLTFVLWRTILLPTHQPAKGRFSGANLSPPAVLDRGAWI